MRSLRAAAAVAVLAASALVLSGCSLLAPLFGGGGTTVTTHTDEEVAAGLEQFYKQDVTWKNCGGGSDCTTLKAPVDWAAPDGEQIELAISRHKASGTSMGSLLINPGGPGGSGFDFAQGFVPSSGVYANYDIIGFDPRGVGRSTPIVCFTDDADRDEMIYGTYDDPYGSEGWQAELDVRQKAWVDACAENTGDLLAHIDTVSVAHDMDMMRAVLGDEKLNYLGYSFGTYIGTVYAELFPEKVGRMVLDGAVSPPFGTFTQLADQMAGFDSAFRAYMAVVPRLGRVPVRRPAEPGARRGARARAQRRRRGPGEQRRPRARLGDGRNRHRAGALQREQLVVHLADVRGAAAGRRRDRRSCSPTATTAGEGGTYADRSLDVYFAVTCAEGDIGTDDVDLIEGLGIMDEKGPYVGGILALDDYTLLESACSQWPHPRPDFPTEFDAAGAPPILVIGTTNDPATPYASAVELSETLESGVLITYNGEGHTVYGNGVACIDDAVDDYFVNDVVPASGPELLSGLDAAARYSTTE